MKDKFCGLCGKEEWETSLKLCKVLCNLHSDNFHVCRDCCLACSKTNRTEGSCKKSAWK